MCPGYRGSRYISHALIVTALLLSSTVRHPAASARATHTSDGANVMVFRDNSGVLLERHGRLSVHRHTQSAEVRVLSSMARCAAKMAVQLYEGDEGA